MRSIVTEISFDVQLSDRELEAIRKLLSGSKEKFQVLKDARLTVRVAVKVKA